MFEFGSSQYDGVYAVYRAYMDKISHKSMEDVCRELGCSIRFDSVCHKEDVAEWVRDGLEAMDYEPELIAEIAPKGATCTDVLHALRDISWDLWGAARFMVDTLFDGPRIDVRDMPSAFGTIKENCEVGICCALLMSFGFVESEEPFTDFDT